MTAPDDVFDGWTVRCIDNVWVADHPQQGFLRDRVDGRYSAQYATRDEVLEHLRGPAK